MNVGKKVLLVEESQVVRAYHQFLLAEEGFAVRQACNGVEGLEWAMREPFDLLVTGIDMTKMDGYAMIRALRQEIPIITTPIIVVTTDDSSHGRQRVLLAGANLFLTHPVDPELFKEMSALMAGVPTT